MFARLARRFGVALACRFPAACGGESLSRVSVSRTCVALNRATGAVGLRVRSRLARRTAPRCAGSRVRLRATRCARFRGALRAALHSAPALTRLAGPPVAARLRRVRCGCARRWGAASAARHWRPDLAARGGRFSRPRAVRRVRGGRKKSLQQVFAAAASHFFYRACIRFIVKRFNQF